MIRQCLLQSRLESRDSIGKARSRPRCQRDDVEDFAFILVTMNLSVSRAVVVHATPLILMVIDAGGDDSRGRTSSISYSRFFRGAMEAIQEGISKSVLINLSCRPEL